MATDYYRLGSGFGDAYLEGQDIAQKRARAAQDAQYNDLRIQQLQGQVGDASLERARQADFYSTLNQIDAPAGAQGTGLPSTAPADAWQGTGVPSGGAGDSASVQPVVPGAPPASGVQATPTQPQRPSRAAAMRVQAQALRKIGKLDQANLADQQARGFDIEDTYNAGASIAADPGKLQAALRMLNKTDPQLTVTNGKDGYYRMSNVAPNGEVHETDMSEADMKHMLGAQALMQAGYAREALPMFASVDSKLAATIAVRNKAHLEEGTFNNKAETDSRNTDARTAMADAALERAQAAQMRAEAASLKGPREMSTEDATMLNNLSLAVDAAPPGADRAKAVAAFRRAQAQVMGRMGKVMDIGEGRTVKPISEADIQAYIDNRSAQDKGFKATSYDNKREAAKAALQGTGGGVAAVDVSAPLPATPAAPAGKGVPMPAAPEKFVRSMGARGSYVYTPSPRGLTMDDYKAMDARR